MIVKRKLKGAPIAAKCLVTGSLMGRIAHELGRAVDEAQEGDRGGAVFHLHNAAEKSELLRDNAPSREVRRVAGEIRSRVRRLERSIAGRRIALEPNEAAQVAAQAAALKRFRIQGLKAAAAVACGLPKK